MPLRLLHFSDLHIGVEGYSRPATEADLERLPPSFAPGVDRRATYLGLPTRLLDALRAFDELVEAALAEQVDLVLFCGDAYRSRDPSQTHQREFARRIARLTGAGIPVFLLAGNHDLPNAWGRATALEIFETLTVPGVSVAARPGAHRVETRAGPVQIVALPWMRRSAVLAQDATRGMTFDEVNDYMQAFLTQTIQREAAALDPALPALLASHVTVSTARLGSERSMMLGTDYTLLPSALADPRFDYVALGHVHLHQALASGPPVVYAGSMHRVDFSEEGQPKGFCLVELDAGRPRGRRVVGWQFREVWARPFLTIKVAVTEEDPDPTATVLAAIGRQADAEAIVRAEVRLPAGQQGRLDLGEVRRVLAAGSHAVAGVHVETPQQERTRLPRGLKVETLGPLQALELYLDSRKTAPERRATLLRYAASLLEPAEALAPSQTAADADVAVRLVPTPRSGLARSEAMEGAFGVRRRVFVEEQGIDPALEWDGQDEGAVHAVALLDGVVVGTGRLLLGTEEGHIGRMAVLPEQRRHGIGGRILATLEEEARRRRMVSILLHAQSHVKEFYLRHGYLEEGEPFLEAGIGHVAMRKTLAGRA